MSDGITPYAGETLAAQFKSKKTVAVIFALCCLGCAWSGFLMRKAMMSNPSILPVFAYAFRTGEIGFGSVMPKGALPIGRIDDKLTEESIRGCTRLAWDGGLLVPGVPEASDDLTALEAFQVWSARLTRKQRDDSAGIATAQESPFLGSFPVVAGRFYGRAR